MAIRGEFIMKNKVFESKYSSQYPKVRSIIAGNINSKKPDKKILRNIEFVSYEMVYPKEKRHTECLEVLRGFGFTVVKYEKTKSVELNHLVDKLKDYKTNSLYPIDGLVVGDNSKPYINDDKATPDHAFAFKMELDEQKMRTKVIKVHWRASKHGKLIPRVQFEPIVIGGDTITYATGFNGSYIFKNKIGSGTIINIIKSGDVIPYIHSVIKSTKSDMPTSKYHWDKTNVNIILDDNSNEEVELYKLKHFMNTLKIASVNTGIIKKLMDAGYNTISKIYNLRKKTVRSNSGHITIFEHSL